MGKQGKDVPYVLRLKIYALAKTGASYYKIAKDLKCDKTTAKRWGSPEAIKEIEESGSVQSKRKGTVGSKPMYNEQESEKLMDKLEEKHMTQSKLAKAEGVDRRTVRKYTRQNAESNKDGCFPYAPRQTPKHTPEIQKQRLEFTKKSPIGKAARGSLVGWKRERVRFGFVDHSPASESGTVNRSHRPNWKRKSTRKREGLEAEEKGKKMAAKHQCFTAVCWKGKKMYCHSKRRIKKRKGRGIRPCYRLEKKKIDTKEVVKIIRNVLGPFFKKNKVNVVFADNDKKLQSRAAEREWRKFGIELWPGAGKVTNHASGGFPVDNPVLMPLDQSIHAAWKTHEGGLYDRWNSMRKDRRTPGAFFNLLHQSWADLPMEKVRAAIDCQRKIIREIFQNKGGITSYDID